MQSLSSHLLTATFSFGANVFELSPDVISLLHHWNFGTTKAYYKSEHKELILPDVEGTWVRIKDIEGALDAALNAYNAHAEEKLREQNEKQ
jgi:hypothetical protein